MILKGKILPDMHHIQLDVERAQHLPSDAIMVTTSNMAGKDRLTSHPEMNSDLLADPENKDSEVIKPLPPVRCQNLHRK